MANTTNLDLVKPAGTDKALVSVINANSDKIDTWAGTTNQALSNIGSKMYAVSGASMTDIPSGADLDTYTTPGSYISRTSAITNSLSNCPFTGHGFNLKVESVAGGSGQYVLQTIRTTDNNVYVRYGATGGWDSQALKSDIDSVEGGVPVRMVGVIANNGTVSFRVSNNFSSNADFAIVCLNISGSATVGYAILALGKGTNKYKDLIGAMDTNAYTCSYSNGTWTITNKCGSDMYYTALVTRVG